MTSRGRRWSAAAGLLAVAAGLAWWWLRADEFRLPARLGTEQVVADLSAAFDHGTVAAEAPADPVRPGVLQPGEPLRGAGPRAVILAPPGARPRFRVTAPAGGALPVRARAARPPQTARPAAPNVLVLLVDTLRADRVGCDGARPSPSPTLDRLAADGLVFENAIAQSSWTLASVASILSGLHPRSHGAISGEPVGGEDHAHGELLPDAVVTWAERAAEAGITTVGVSSNPLVSRATNLAQGFETFAEFTWDPRGRNWTSAAEVNRTFLSWLARNRGYRFAGYLHYMEPHDPYTPPASLRPAPPAGLQPALAAGWVRDAANRINWDGAAPLSPSEIGYLRGLYDGEVRAWDAELATLLEGLAKLGVRDSTLVIVTADHGEEFQEHGMLTHGAHLYQESLRVPLVISGPRVAPGRRTDLAQGIDLFPTLAAYLGIPPPAGLPGRDLLSGPQARPAVSETARGIGPNGKPMDVVSVVTAGWQLIHSPKLGRFELYDLDHDPGEQQNRWGAVPEGEALREVLERWPESLPVPLRAAAPDPTVVDRLRALGYVQ